MATEGESPRDASRDALKHYLYVFGVTSLVFAEHFNADHFAKIGIAFACLTDVLKNEKKKIIDLNKTDQHLTCMHYAQTSTHMSVYMCAYYQNYKKVPEIFGLYEILKNVSIR